MPKTLLDILVDTKKVTEEDAKKLAEEVKASKKQEEDFLLTKLPENDVFFAKSKFYGVPLKRIPDDYPIPDEALFQIPEEVAKTYKIIPIGKSGNDLEIGMVNPQDIKASDAVRFIITSKSLNAHIFLVTATQFSKLVKRYSGLNKKVNEALEEAKDDISAIQKTKIESMDDEEEKLEEEAPVNKIINVIFRHAYEGKASDIHIEALEKSTRVRFRIDGILHSSLTLPKEIHESIVSKIKILSGLKIDESRTPQDGRFRTHIDENPIDFRVSTFPTVEGEKVVLRLLDLSTGLKSLEELGFYGPQAKAIARAVSKPFGMVLTTGPTGSGKSTTLQSLLGSINNEKINIVSLEDPVEYYVDGVNQSQIRPEISYTFASGLRSILRQDPNVIMVGEIRDAETAELSVHAALTGHIVLSTLHTNDVIGSIPRLIDMGVEPFLLPSSLNLVIAQRLVRRLCDNCKVAMEPEGRAREILEENIAEMPKFLQDQIKNRELKIYQAPGCVKCGRKGARGRIVVYELLEMTTELKKIILNKEDNSKIFEEAKRQDMVTMRQDGIVKALDGVVSLEEVLQVTV